MGWRLHHTIWCGGGGVVGGCVAAESGTGVALQMGLFGSQAEGGAQAIHLMPLTPPTFHPCTATRPTCQMAAHLEPC